MERSIVFICLFAIILFAQYSPAMDIDDNDDAPISPSAPWLKISNETRFDVTAKESEDYSRNLRYGSVSKLEWLVNESIKVVIETEYVRYFLKNNHSVEAPEFDLGEILKSAYVEIKMDGDFPVAMITLGKHEMAFGNGKTGLPMKKDHLLEEINQVDEVFGITVQLPKNFLSIANQVAISVYETTSEDFRISSQKGFSAQMLQQINAQLETQVSALIQESETTGNQKKLSVGFKYTTRDGKRKFWCEGLILENTPDYIDADYAFTIGGSEQIGPGDVVIEYTVIDQYAYEVGLGYNYFINERFYLGPEVRSKYNELTQANDLRIGIRLKVRSRLELKRELLKHR